jgi:hypothetical protein
MLVRRFELFHTLGDRRRVLVGFLLTWGNQFSGILLVTKEGKNQKECDTDSY